MRLRTVLDGMAAFVADAPKARTRAA